MIVFFSDALVDAPPPVVAPVPPVAPAPPADSRAPAPLVILALVSVKV